MTTKWTLALALAAALAAWPARAGDEAALEPHADDALKFQISIPAEWKETKAKQPNTAKWIVEDREVTCEVTAYKERNDLAAIEQNLKAKAQADGWKDVDGPKRVKVDGCEAIYFLFELPSANRFPARQLFVVVQEPSANYVITYGDLARQFDRELADRIAFSFKCTGAPELPGAGPTATTATAAAATPAAAGESWGCPACKKPWPQSQKFCGDCGGKNGPLYVEKKHWGCPTCKKDWPETMKFCGECGAKCDSWVSLDNAPGR
ncbi:MAG TPA: zinc ribbon domain-containing protein [Planctomycetota bacterium]|nr:zinc ribbon domain-containing protein [Planctomycetota bacterium]